MKIQMNVKWAKQVGPRIAIENSDSLCQGLEKNVFLKAQPTGFYWVWGFIIFFRFFLFE